MNGYKTYLIAALGVVVAGLSATGYITEGQANLIYGILGSLGLATLRHGIKKVE